MRQTATMLGVIIGHAVTASAAHAEPVARLGAGQAGRIEFRSLGRDGSIVWADLALARSGAAKQPATIAPHPADRRRAMADVKRFVGAHLLGASARKGTAR